MNVNEVLRRISFKVGTLDDIAGKAINNIIDNRIVIDELNTQMNQYANITKGITDVYSFHLHTNTPIVEAPILALRSESYYYMFIINSGTIFPLDMRSARDVYPRFRYNPVSGISNWIMPWGNGKTQYLSVFPMNNKSGLSTTLTANVSAVAQTIPVASTSGFINNSGRVTIGSEKILYGRKDTVNFYDCIRGVEMTTPAIHTSGDTVNENNVVLMYSRLPEKIIVTDDNIVDPAVLAHEIEIVEEHIEGIVKAVAYNLLLKLDPERSIPYKVDTDELYAQYKRDIMKGYYRGRQGTGIREPFAMNEAGMPYGTNIAGY